MYYCQQKPNNVIEGTLEMKLVASLLSEVPAIGFIQLTLIYT